MKSNNSSEMSKGRNHQYIQFKLQPQAFVNASIIDNINQRECTPLNNKTYECTPLNNKTYECTPLNNKTYECTPLNNKTYKCTPLNNKT
jgi:hypothetical protein